MCGIVGYIGDKDAYPILIKGLHRLEYRGYDSAGIALITGDEKLQVYKTRGKVSDLEKFVKSKDISGSIGIAHTRWATHGEPNDANAHPHYSQSENIALIHNGIIENYALLKEDLVSRGYIFRSQTDTEVLVQLIEFVMTNNNLDLFHAVQQALTQVIGAYAIAVIEKNNPDCIVAARKASPLVVGIGDNDFYLGSDASPIIEYTNRVIYIEDDEVVKLEKGKEPRIFNLSNVEKIHEIKQLEMSLGQLEKGGYPHFMLKEIFEQPNTIRECMRGRINIDRNSVAMSGIIDNKDKFVNAKRIIIVACGTSWHAGLIGEYLIEEFARIPVEVEYASEFRYRNPIISKDDIVIAISQSGETADTLAAVELARSQGAFVYGICNVVGSSIPRMTHSGSYTHAGPEIGVASTKAFTTQVTVLAMMAFEIGFLRGTITGDRYRELIDELVSVPSKIEKALQVSLAEVPANEDKQVISWINEPVLQYFRSSESILLGTGRTSYKTECLYGTFEEIFNA